MIDLNLVGAFDLIKAAFYRMKKDWRNRIVPSRSENKTKPHITSIISASSGAMKADVVAKKILDGIKSGSFIISCNTDGLLLSIATAGLSPQRSSLMAFLEMVSAGILRIEALCFQWN